MMTEIPSPPRQSSIIPLCASFIGGVTLSTILSRGIAFPPPFAALFYLMAIILFFTGMAAILIPRLYPQALLFFCLSLLFLGLARHTQAIDTSSPYHLTNFLRPQGEKTLIRGIVVGDPERREEFSILTIRPKEITPYPRPEAYLRLDLKVAYKVKTARIIGVFDGDTLLTGEGKVVRLLGVEAPELGKPGAKEATNFTRSMTLHRQVTLYIQEDYPLDRWGRILAAVELEGRLLNSQLIEKGLAEYYPCPYTEILHYERYEDQKKTLRGRTGYIRVRVHPTVGEYYGEVSFGDYVEIIAPLRSPREGRNPGAFDFSRWLRVRNIYAVTSLLREPGELRFLGEGEVNPFIKFSLRLRHRILGTIERTVPYPEERAFLAAVTLGKRGGLSPEVRDQFRATGVAHVLALSGLHTGFIALLLIGAARLLRLPKSMRFLWVSLGLLIFVFLSGASPATQRAALMFSLGMLLYDLLKVSLVSSVGITIFLSAVIVLFINPLWLTDASFVLSYAAILSLAYLTRPIEKIIMSREIRRGGVGFPLIGILVGMSFFSLSGIIQHLSIVRRIFPAVERIPPLLDWFPAWGELPGHSWLYRPQFLVTTLLLGAVSIALFFIYRHFRGGDLTVELSRWRWGRWLLRFCFAQLAIQLGMLWPLLAGTFFLRFPIAGFYANIMAIPLLGAIVMLGWIAGLTELFFSVIGLGFMGLGLAGVINGFNTVLCQAFLGLARTFYDFIPFPYIDAYGIRGLTLWYGIVFLFAFHERIFQKIGELKRRLGQRKKQLAILAVISLFMVVGASLHLTLRRPPLRVVFFDAGLGNAVLVSTPRGKNILIDGGPRRDEWSFGRTIRETLSHYRISRLNYVIITSLRPGNIGGLGYLLEHIPVKRVVLPVKEEMLRADLSYEEFLLLLDDWRLLSQPFRSFPQRIYAEYMALMKLVEDIPLKVETIRKSRLLHSEEGLKIEALFPGLARGGLDDNFSFAVRIQYREKVIILPTQVGVAAQKSLAQIYPDKLLGEVMLIVAHGNPEKQAPEFIAAISPSLAINQYGWSPGAEFFSITEKEVTLTRLEEMGITTYSTAKSGAIILTTDGRELNLRAKLAPQGGKSLSRTTSTS